MSTPTDRALVFDMDGVLIDSEPLWRRAEIEIFAGVGLSITETDCYQTQGLRIDEAVGFWFARAPWSGPTPTEVAHTVVERMVELIRAEGVPMPGALESIEAARRGGWRLAVASSSSDRLIGTVLDRFDLARLFECTRSAEHEAHGKPHPDVYLAAARELALPTRACVAVEDSAHGVTSALAAGLRGVAVPPPETRDDPRFAAATMRLASLEALPARLAELAVRTETGTD
ncbi:MAG: hexitol phosphatase HxpB [Myxococcota bacterium]